MPKELILRVRVPTKEEILETVKKTIEQLEGVVMGSVQIVEVPTPTPAEQPPAQPPQPTKQPSETGTPTQPPDTGTGEQK